MSLITLSNLRKVYTETASDVVAVDSVDLTLEAGEFAAQATPSAFAQRSDGLQCGPEISRRQVFGQFTFGDRQNINP